MRRLFWQILIIIGLTGCAVWRTPHIARIALLAPFEGRYREIGYSAIYPARMALADMGLAYLELLAVDDGGTIQTAQARARALVLDDSIKAVMILGYDSADQSVLQVLSDMPIIIIGEWATVPIRDGVFILSHVDIPAMLSYVGRLDITATIESPFFGGDAFGLFAYADLYNHTRPAPHVQVVTSGRLADEAFTARLLASDIYVPRPNHLSTMVYDATRLLATVIADGDVSRQAVIDALYRVDFMGEQVGRIDFGDDGYWADAPLYTYVYADIDADGYYDLSPVADTP
jgi:ABC-type branched-subunit amino acid transport system substrate-binding protein